MEMKKNAGFQCQQVVEALKRALADGSEVLMAIDMSSGCQTGGLRNICGDDIKQYLSILEDKSRTFLIGISGDGECLFTKSNYKYWMIHFDFVFDVTCALQVQFDPYYLFQA